MPAAPYDVAADTIRGSPYLLVLRAGKFEPLWRVLHVRVFLHALVPGAEKGRESGVLGGVAVSRCEPEEQAQPLNAVLATGFPVQLAVSPQRVTPLFRRGQRAANLIVLAFRCPFMLITVSGPRSHTEGRGAVPRSAPSVELPGFEALLTSCSAAWAPSTSGATAGQQPRRASAWALAVASRAVWKPSTPVPAIRSGPPPAPTPPSTHSPSVFRRTTSTSRRK